MQKSINPPALQHLARVTKPTAAEVKKALIDGFLKRAQFSYSLLSDLVRTSMTAASSGITLSESALTAAIKKRQPNAKYQKILLEVVPLLHSYFSTIAPKYILDVDARKYLINDLAIPFKPPFAFESQQQIIIPWFIFWKSNPLTRTQISLLATLIFEIIAEDPDFKDAKVLIFDFSEKAPGIGRSLIVTDAATIDRLSDQDRDNLLETFMEGFLAAKDEIAKMSIPKRKKSSTVHDKNFSLDLDAFDDNNL